jgi:hypothetical protein
VTASVGETRTEQDYVSFLDTLFAAGAPTTKGRVIADNLNTHVSESVVRLIARLCDIEDDLGEKGKSGVLASMATREAFLRDQRDQLSLHAQARFLAQPDRNLVLHPRAQTPAPPQLHFQRTPEGSHRSLHRPFQSHPRQAVQVDYDRKTARRMTLQMGFVLLARRTSLGQVVLTRPFPRRPPAARVVAHVPGLVPVALVPKPVALAVLGRGACACRVPALPIRARGPLDRTGSLRSAFPSLALFPDQPQRRMTRFGVVDPHAGEMVEQKSPRYLGMWSSSR